MVEVEVKFPYQNRKGEAVVPGGIVGEHEGPGDLVRGDGPETPGTEMLAWVVLIARTYMHGGGFALDWTLRPELCANGAEESLTVGGSRFPPD